MKSNSRSSIVSGRQSQVQGQRGQCHTQKTEGTTRLVSCLPGPMVCPSEWLLGVSQEQTLAHISCKGQTVTISGSGGHSSLWQVLRSAIVEWKQLTYVNTLVWLCSNKSPTTETGSELACPKSYLYFADPWSRGSVKTWGGWEAVSFHGNWSVLTRRASKFSPCISSVLYIIDSWHWISTLYWQLPQIYISNLDLSVELQIH